MKSALDGEALACGQPLSRLDQALDFPQAVNHENAFGFRPLPFVVPGAVDLKRARGGCTAWLGGT